MKKKTLKTSLKQDLLDLGYEVNPYSNTCLFAPANFLETFRKLPLKNLKISCNKTKTFYLIEGEYGKEKISCYLTTDNKVLSIL